MNEQTSQKMTEISISESYARHQRQRFWQIIAPVGLGVLLILVVLALVIFTAVGTQGDEPVSQWADTSMIWLSMPALLFTLILVLILFAMIFLLAKLLKILPKYTMTLQQYAAMISRSINHRADQLVAPIIGIRGGKATVSAFLNALLGRRRD